MKKKIDPLKRFLALSDAEKDAEVAEFDNEEIDMSKWRPLTPAERKRWQRIKRKLNRGRPVVGRGAKVVAVSIERGLLQRADRFAKKRGMKRAELIAQGLELAMAG